MGYITGTYKNPKNEKITIVVDSKERGSIREPWEICCIGGSVHDIRTPGQLIELGTWLVSIGKYIKDRYNPNGTKKSKKQLQAESQTKQS